MFARLIRRNDDPEPLAYETAENVLVRMVDLRKRVDRRIRWSPRAGHWPMFKLWLAPEGHLLRLARRAAWLQDGGLPPREAWLSICPGATEAITAARDVACIRRAGLRRVLEVVDPPYLKLSDDVVSAVAALATARAAAEVEQAYQGKCHPPTEWLREQVSFDEFEQECLVNIKGDHWNRETQAAAEMRDWNLPTDEIWRFHSPPETWRAMCGRGGYALVRRGRPIASTVRIMN